MTRVETVSIDGARGEGGGQIVRTAIALSCITKKPIIIENIRKNRKVSGLRAQHVAAIRILQKACNAKVDGAVLGSTELSFVPGDIGGCEVQEDIGTAGSVCLALQPIIPLASILRKEFKVEISGGTDVPWSPTFNYIANVVRHAFDRIGLKFDVELNGRGYYPRGGGKVTLKIRPSAASPFRLMRRGTSVMRVECTYSKIPKEVVTGEVGRIVRVLKGCHTVVQQVREEDALDEGAALLVHAHDDNSIIGTDALFDRKTGRFGIKLDKLANCLGVDENLADMIVVPASIAPGTSVFRVPNITRHLETNLFVASKISGCRYGVGKVRGGFEIRIKGTSHAGIH